MTTGCSKHMVMRNYFYREKLESGDNDVPYCPTENILAEMLIKPLMSARHDNLCNAITGLPA
jgi:predicted restriction endonuclease